MTNILFVLSHPKPKSLNHYLYEDLNKHLSSNINHQIKTIDLYKEKFEACSLLTREDCNEEIILKYQRMLMWSDHIIFIFPVWWYNYPAALKGFFDRVFVPHFAYKYNEKGLPEGLLKNKTSSIIRTFGSPRIAKLWFGNGNLKGLIRGTLGFCGIKNKEVFDLHEVNLKSFSSNDVENFLKKIRKLKLR